MSKLKYFSGNNSVYVFLSWALLIFAFLFLFSWRFIFHSQFAGTWDQVDFALGVLRFDLLAMQPHFPGYPYFVFGGMVVNHWIVDPVAALSIFNSIMVLLSVIPIFLLGRRLFSRLLSGFLAFFILSFSYYSVTTIMPMSEGAALSLMWWYFWALVYSFDKEDIGTRLLPLFLFSLLLGTRLSYLAFGVGIIYLWWVDWKKFRSFFRITFFAACAILFQLIWVGSLVLTEGSISGFLTLALSFTNGHFTEWGGAVTVTETSYLNRLYTLIWNNLLWSGFLSQSYILLICALPLFFILVGQWMNNTRSKHPFLINLLLSLAISYSLWVFFAQNPDKPRHIIPVNSIIAFIVFYQLTSNRRYVKMKWFFLSVFAILQLSFSVHLIKEQAMEKPATYQLTEYLESVEEHFIVYTWEEERIMDYQQSSFSYSKVLSYEYFLVDISFQQPGKIYITDSVVKGFRNQGVDITPSITKVKTFHSNPLIEPVYHTIVLYEYDHH